MEEEKNKRKTNVKELQKGTNKARQNYDATRRIAADKSNELGEVKLKMSECVVKMKFYKERMTQAENRTPLMEQIEMVKQEVQSLQSKKSELEKRRTELLTNEEGVVVTKEQILSGIAEIRQRIDERKDEHQDKIYKLESAQEKRRGLEMTKFILKKRNSALLTRMKRKMEDQKDKCASLLAHREYLLKMCETTHKKLERFSETP